MSNKRFDNTPTFIVGDDPVIIQKDTVSTANVFETKDFSGTTKVSISADGVLTASGLSVTGDLTVDGTTTTINSTTLTVDDKNIVLGDVSSPTDTTADGGGITLKGATDKTIAWNSSSGGWEFAPTGIFTTVTTQGRALAIRGDSSESNGIIQFTNNAVSAQWASISATSAGKLVISTQADGVGIGGTPSHPFHVQSSNYDIAKFQSSGAETKVTLHTTSTDGRQYSLISGGSGGAYAGGYFGIYDNTAAANRLSINSSGTIYIPGQVNVIAGGQDGGLMFRPWTAAGGYVSIATRDMAGAEYMMLSDGTNTFISCGSGGTTYMRGPANSTTGQLYVTGSEAGSSGHFYAQSTVTLGGTGTNAVSIPYCAMLINRLWDGYPGIQINNDTTWGPITEFRIHGYSGASGGDFGINLRVDGSYLTLSDERVKTDIVTIDNPLSIISNLRGVRYSKMNRSLEIETHSNIANGRKFGLIAQEALPYIPEVIAQTPDSVPLDNGWCDEYAMDYSSLVPLLLEGIKELKSRIEALEN
jgi:hypothetical protein